MSWHSQFGEDKWLWETGRLNGPGTFCEVGAYDGFSGSNTLFLEENGWTGLLIEADPDIAAQCRARRKAVTFSTAIGMPASDQLLASFCEFYVNVRDRGVSGLRGAGAKIYVPCIRLDFALMICGIEKLDLLSIDTEGTELDVWKSLAHFATRPRLVIMEFWTQPNPPIPEPIVAQMQADGYREIHRTEANLIFEKV